MGIESLSGITGAHSYQSSANTQTVKPVAETTADSGVSESSQSVTTDSPVVIGQVAQSQGSANQGSSTDRKSEDNTKEATMKDVKEINKIINNNTVAEFGYNEPTKRITIKIKDKDTGDVIKEIPSEKALEMLAKAWELAGIMVDEKR